MHDKWYYNTEKSIFAVMHNILKKYLPEHALDACIELIKIHKINLKIVNQRVTRHGDYRRLPNGQHQITVNANLNTYRFLITLIHEIAHLVAYKEYKNTIKPHGTAWKQTFTRLMLPFMHPGVFPEKLLPLIAQHFRNPRASSDTDVVLSLALKEFDPVTDKSYIFEIPSGTLFKSYNGKLFKKGKKRVKRYECIEVKTGRMYVFSPHAEVTPIAAENT